MNYTVTASNAGPLTATNVVIADPIPSGLTFNAAGSPGCIQNGSSVLCNNFSLNNGQSRSFTIAFTVSATATCGGVIQNQASVSTSATDPNPGNNQSAVVQTTVNCAQCSDGVDNDNDGATDFPNDFSCSDANDNDETNPKSQCQDGIDNDNDGYVDFGTGAGNDPGCASKQDNDEGPFNANADLRVVKTADKTSILPGETITYTLTVSTTGPDTAQNVVISDSLPAGVSFAVQFLQTDGFACSQQPSDPNHIVCTRPTMNANSTATIRIQATEVSSGGSCTPMALRNTVSVSATGSTDPNSSNNSSEVTSQLRCPSSDLSIIKSADKTTLLPGETIIYTLAVTSNGPDGAGNVVVSDMLPSGTAFDVLFLQTDGFVCSQQPSDQNHIVCTRPTMSAGSSAIIRIQAKVRSSGACVAKSLRNTAMVSSSVTPDPNGTNNSSEVTSQLTCPNADLFITKSGIGQIQRGSTLLYTVTAFNLGPNTATNVVIADPLPAGVTFNAAQSSSGCVLNGANILCNNFTLVNGASKTVQIAVDVPATFTPCDGQISNQASVSTSATDPNPGNNQSAVVQSTVTCPNVTYTISKTDGKTTVNPGETVTYTITATNTSTVNDTNVTITDTLPSNVTFVSASGGTLNGNSVAFVLPSIAAGQTITRSVTVTVNANTTNGTVLTNVATVRNFSANDTTTVQVIVQNQADLFITKSGIGQIQRGSTLLYTVTAFNLGPNTATNVVIADPLPAGVTFNAAQSSSGCVLNGANILCNNFTLVNGASKTVQIAVDVPATFTPCDGQISNQASVSTSATDPNPGNNQSAVVQSTVTCPNVTYTISKTDGKTTVNPGETVTYTITATNTSTVNDTNVTITDTLPSNVTFVSASGGTLNGNSVAFVLPSIAAGQTITRSVTVTVNANTTNGTVLTNVATVRNFSANDTTTVQVVTTATDMGLTMTAPSTVQRGSTLSYQINVTNLGIVAASNVQVVDPPVPAGNTTFNSGLSSASCTQSGSQVICNVGTVTPGQTVTLTVTYNVLAQTPCTGTITLQNTATVTSSTTDPNATNNSATVSTTVTCPVATFLVSKTDNKTTATPGETLTYVITARNTSSTVATNVQLTDTLPGNITFVSASGGILNGNVVTFVIGAMGSGQTITRSVVVTINSGVTNGTILTNTAAIGSFQSQDTTTVQATATPTFTMTKTDGKTTATPGETLTYTIGVTNTSAVAGTNVVVTDTLPSNVTFLSASGAVRNGNTVTYTVGSIAAGQTVNLSLQVQVNAGTSNGTLISNTASIGTVSAQDTTTVQGTTQATLTLSLTDSTDPVAPGQSYTYSIQLTNIGGTPATGVGLTQVLDGDTEFLSASNNGTNSNNVVTWTNLTIPANGSLQLITSVRAKSTVQDGRVLNSTAFSNSLSDTETTLVRTSGTGTRDITIVVRDSVDPVEPSECFDYLLTVRNNRGITEVVDVTGFLDDDTEFRDADRGGQLLGNTRIEWQDISIGANSSVQLRAGVCVNTSVSDGQNLQFRGRVENAEDTEYTRVVFFGKPIPPIIPPIPGALITVDKSADRQEAQPGSIILYTVTIRNQGGVPTGDIVVEDVFSAGTITVEEAGGGVITGNGITWTGISLGANSTRVLQYRVRVSPSMRHGEIISNTVTVRSPLGVMTDNEQVRILSGLPQTGNFLGGDLNQHLRPRTGAASDADVPLSSLPMILWTQLLAIGLGAGSWFGKKAMLGI